jgi:peptidoglycan/LPS O-acetylase OafA/YrhL
LLVPLSRAILSTRIPLWLGKISFSLYLVHFPILFTVGFAVFNVAASHFSYSVAVAFTTGIVGTGTLICAFYFERWVDRPALDFAKRLSKRKPIERAQAPL